jgi:hypothetical protein
VNIYCTNVHGLSLKFLAEARYNTHHSKDKCVRAYNSLSSFALALVSGLKKVTSEK